MQFYRWLSNMAGRAACIDQEPAWQQPRPRLPSGFGGNCRREQCDLLLPPLAFIARR
jgi:hypothetical protein